MREKEKATRVILVRHGETDFPKNRIYCDAKEDPALNSTGQAQARQAAEFLSLENISAIYASPSLRTRMTAEAIAKYHDKLSIEFDPNLVERNFGDWEGMYFDDIESQYPQKYKEWKQNQAAFKIGPGESVYDLLERVAPSVSRIVTAYTGQTVVVVTHVGPIRVLLAKALNLPIEGYRQLAIDPASVTGVDYGASQNNLMFMNFHGRHFKSEKY